MVVVVAAAGVKVVEDQMVVVVSVRSGSGITGESFKTVAELARVQTVVQNHRNSCESR